MSGNSGNSGNKRRGNQGGGSSGNRPKTATTPAGGASSGGASGGGSARADSRRAQRVAQQQKARRNRILALLGGAAALAIVGVIAVIAITQGDSAGPAADDPVTTPPVALPDVERQDNRLGSADAKVKVVEWADYQCPGCGQFARQSEQQLVEQYVTTGNVSFEYHDFPFLGDESRDAAEAAWCANDQGKYWEYNQILFYNQSGENRGAFAQERLIEMARAIGLDVEQFTSCIEGDEHEQRVEDSYDAARDLNLTQTPTFFVNERMITANSFEEISQAIEEELAQ